MSTTIYMIRHGQSIANERHAFIGHTDLDLTDLGRKQAAATADYLFGLGIKPTAIYSSDLLRAYHTAQATAERFSMAIIKEEGLREIYAGLWENQSVVDLKMQYPTTFAQWGNDVGRACPDGGESVRELWTRVNATVERLAVAHDGGTILLFTHATPIRAVAAYAEGIAAEELRQRTWAPNASTTKLVHENGVLHLESYGYSDYMGDLVTGRPVRE